MPDVSVLIVDDDEVAAEILQKFTTFSFPDARIEWSWDGFQALLVIEEVNPDIILLDYMMPKIDGMVFLEKMRALMPKQDARIIVVTAYADAKLEKEFLDRGVDMVLSKPITYDNIKPLFDSIKQKLIAEAN
ncbi:MAG TPA: response regulator [bacterium]|nr:response regulator [bacterium]